MFTKEAQHQLTARWGNVYALALAIYVGSKKAAQARDPGSRMTKLPPWVRQLWDKLPSDEAALEKAAVEILLDFNGYKPRAGPKR